MEKISKKQRFEAILSGKKLDRPIVSGWHHFLEHEHTAEDLAQATIDFARKYDWDWIKINPRATYLAEAFGNTYDFADYQWVFPKQTKAMIEKTADLWKVKEVDVGQSAPLQEQLAALSKIRAGLPDTPLVQTVFSPLTILMFLTGNSSYVDKTMYGSEAPPSFQKLLETDRAGIHYALNQIAQTMARYVEQLEHKAVDGLFYAVTGTTHPGLFSEAMFNELSRPYDAIVLDAMKQGKRILHTCGSYADPERFDDYPIEGTSWDTEAEGNPSLAIELKKTKVAGVDHQIFDTTDPTTIKGQVDDALKLMVDQPFMLVPNCAVSVTATAEALTALKESVK